MSKEGPGLGFLQKAVLVLLGVSLQQPALGSGSGFGSSSSSSSNSDSGRGLSSGLGSNSGSDQADSFRLLTAWTPVGTNQELKSWTVAELLQMKQFVSREKDPISGKIVKWQGVLLSQVVEKALDRLPIENRAQIDLVILRNESGESALLPRAFVGKYPLLLALRWNSSEDGGSGGAGRGNKGSDRRGPIYSVVPWSSKPKILREDLLLEGLFLPSVSRLELTSYRDQFSSVFLKRRTDPTAIRGEKLFVQNCAGCHAFNHGSSLPGALNDQKIQRFVGNGHPAAKGAEKLQERDRRSIVRFLDAHRLENPNSFLNPIRSVQAQQLQSKGVH